MQQLIARSLDHGQPVRLCWEGATIVQVEPTAGRDASQASDLWVAPAYWDIQTNGHEGVSFSDAELTVKQVGRIVRAHAGHGVARLCPTLITATSEATRRALMTLDQACREDALVGSMVAGIHLEGPYLSGLDGYRGAHRGDLMRDPSWEEFRAWRVASGNRICLITLAPERQGSIAFIRQASAAGIVVALGHTAADTETLKMAAAAGARLSTHLGNGIASPLNRHPNPIWDQAADDRLCASLIADGHHLGRSILRTLVRAKGLERVILVSDFSPLAGLPVGTYGAWAVDPSGKIVVAGTPYLAGSAQDLTCGLNVLMAASGLSPREAVATVTANPARLLGHAAPLLAAGQPASFVCLAEDGDQSLRLVQTVVDGIVFPKC